MSHSYPSDISREQFALVFPSLVAGRRRTKPRTVDLYDVFCGVLYVLKSGCQWPAHGLPQLANLLQILPARATQPGGTFHSGAS